MRLIPGAWLCVCPNNLGHVWKQQVPHPGHHIWSRPNNLSSSLQNWFPLVTRYKWLAKCHTHHRSANHHLLIMSSFGLLHTSDFSRTAKIWCLCGLIMSYHVLSSLIISGVSKLHSDWFCRFLQYIFPQVVCLVCQSFPPQLHVPWDILLKQQGNKCMNGTKPTKAQTKLSGFPNIQDWTSFQQKGTVVSDKPWIICDNLA